MSEDTAVLVLSIGVLILVGLIAGGVVYEWRNRPRGPGVD